MPPTMHLGPNKINHEFEVQKKKEKKGEEKGKGSTGPNGFNLDQNRAAFLNRKLTGFFTWEAFGSPLPLDQIKLFLYSLTRIDYLIGLSVLGAKVGILFLT